MVKTNDGTIKIIDKKFGIIKKSIIFVKNKTYDNIKLYNQN